MRVRLTASSPRSSAMARAVSRRHSRLHARLGRHRRRPSTARLDRRARVEGTADPPQASCPRRGRERPRKGARPARRRPCARHTRSGRPTAPAAEVRLAEACARPGESRCDDRVVGDRRDRGRRRPARSRRLRHMLVLVVPSHPGLRPPVLLATTLGYEIEVVVRGVQEIDSSGVRR
jgi:hypothetical protein